MPPDYFDIRGDPWTNEEIQPSYFEEEPSGKKTWDVPMNKEPVSGRYRVKISHKEYSVTTQGRWLAVFSKTCATRGPIACLDVDYAEYEDGKDIYDHHRASHQLFMWDNDEKVKPNRLTGMVRHLDNY